MFYKILSQAFTFNPLTISQVSSVEMIAKFDSNGNENNHLPGNTSSNIGCRQRESQLNRNTSLYSEVQCDELIQQLCVKSVLFDVIYENGKYLQFDSSDVTIKQVTEEEEDDLWFIRTFQNEKQILFYSKFAISKINAEGTLIISTNSKGKNQTFFIFKLPLKYSLENKKRVEITELYDVKEGNKVKRVYFGSKPSTTEILFIPNTTPSWNTF